MVSALRFAMELMKYGEAVHGGPVERTLLEMIAQKFPEHRRVPVNTKFWEVNFSDVFINGERVEHTLMPYTKGCVKGKLGREIMKVKMPEHPFLIKRIDPKGYEGVLFFEEGKLRRITLPEGFPPSAFVSREPEDDAYVEVCGEGRLIDSNSFNVEVTVREGDSYVIVGAHVDHWLTGFHDNLLSVGLLVSLVEELNRMELKRGVKLLFLSSEEGPRCCTGSQQYDERNLHAFISVDAIYPSREVLSATPDLWFLSRQFVTKRVEMPTPFSDHFPFVLKGHPGMAIYNDDMTSVYHSNRDLPVSDDEAYVERLRSSLLNAIRELSEKSREELDRFFMEYARGAGYIGGERRGAIVPDYDSLSSKFRRGG
ncbi:MAG: M28 family peptidase [Metallosphaera yellowstonensis]|uniref:Putative aminopeptidase, Iap family n=1 Tax=Metallosphaera yellowstonensis MK1 TaxID=671065 RepID=H2C7F4_9CREN|nr:M28 family peptidase [Metallosphaera yellowstonensis]EHP68080.1 putative aminopeptidase, Iap family [Metallosphaera yellowstonensis MK1]